MAKKCLPVLILTIMIAVSIFCLSGCELFNSDNDNDSIIYTLEVINGKGGGTYESGTEVTVIAEEIENKQFSAWQIDGATVSSAREYKFKLNKDITITAIYNDIVVYYTVSTNEISERTANVEEGLGQYLVNTEVTVKAKLSAYNVFLYWKVGEEVVSYDREYTFRITKSIEIVPVYDSYSAGLCFSYNEQSDSYAVIGYETTYIASAVVIPGHYNDGTNGLKTVTEIGDNAFNEFSSDILTVNMPDSITKLGSYALSCESLTSVILPRNLVSIGENCFSGCNKITQIDIFEKVEMIGANAFRGCSMLQAINVDGENINFDSIDGVLFDDGALTLIYYPNGKTETAYVIPKSVTNISGNAFTGYLYLTTLSFETGTQIEQINGYVFDMVHGIENFIIPASVETIENMAFYSCGDFNNITFASGSLLKTIQSYAFYACTDIISLVLPDGLTTIGASAFEGCTHLTDITMPASVKIISSKAFYNCNSMYSITINSGVITIGDNAFSGCVLLKTVYVYSQTIATYLTSAEVFGGLMAYADYIAIGSQCTTTSYITDNYQYSKVHTGFTIYSKNDDLL